MTEVRPITSAVNEKSSKTTEMGSLVPLFWGYNQSGVTGLALYVPW